MTMPAAPARCMWSCTITADTPGHTLVQLTLLMGGPFHRPLAGEEEVWPRGTVTARSIAAMAERILERMKLCDDLTAELGFPVTAC